MQHDIIGSENFKMKLTPKIAQDFSHLFSTREKIQKFISEFYPSGLAGELLFKRDAHAHGLKKIIKKLEEPPSTERKYNVIIIGDAKLATERFALCDVHGRPLMHGHYLEKASDQSHAEVLAFEQAIHFVRTGALLARINLTDINLIYLTDAQILTTMNPFNSDPSIVTHAFDRALRALSGMSYEISWIRGADNPADYYTLNIGYGLFPDYSVFPGLLEPQQISMTPTEEKEN